MFAEITEYRMAVYSRNPPSHHLAAIALKSGVDGFVGIIYFWDRNRGTLPDAVITETNASMHFFIDMLDSVVDLLRNESPVYLSAGDGTALLRTWDESVGEGEIPPP